MKNDPPDTDDAGAASEDGRPADAPGVDDAASPATIAELRSQAAKAAENWEKFMRLAADFENYKKRAARERIDATKYANESLLQKLIGVLDNFDMAVAAAAGSQDPAVQSLQTGVNMILAQLRGVLTDSGLEEINAAEEAFDPNLHEAISQQDRADLPEGRVVQQVRKGYKFRDRLLRPASVIVSRRPAN